MNKFISAAAVLAASMISNAAMAQAYVSAGAGFGHINVDCAGATTCDNNGTSGKIVGGYAFPGGLAVELGYISFGESKVADSGASLTLKPTAITLAAAFRAPLSGDFGGSARLGVANVQTKADATLGAQSGSKSETKAQAYFGLGLDYAVTKQLKLEASADFSNASFSGEKGAIRAFNFGARFDF